MPSTLFGIALPTGRSGYADLAIDGHCALLPIGIRILTALAADASVAARKAGMKAILVNRPAQRFTRRTALQTGLTLFATTMLDARRGASIGQESLVSKEQPTGAPSGAADFDFLIGEWSVRHRRLERRLAQNTNWIEFAGRASARKILDGLGNIDEMPINLPTGPYHGATLRLFNPSTERWSIHWMDSRNPGLDPPMFGRFNDGRGVFYGDDTFEGRSIRVRFIWDVLSPAACRWEQAFSADQERSWETNWTMDFTRVVGPATRASSRPGLGS